MARSLRIEYPNGWYHTLRRVRRKELIFIGKRDYYRFVDLLKATSAQWNPRLASYCLMPKLFSIFVNFSLKAALTIADKYLFFRIKWAESLYEKLK
jgi:hypothetical protein